MGVGPESLAADPVSVVDDLGFMLYDPLPQGVVLTHGNMAFTLGAFLYNLDPKPDDM